MEKGSTGRVKTITKMATTKKKVNVMFISNNVTWIVHPQMYNIYTISSENKLDNDAAG